MHPRTQVQVCWNLSAWRLSTLSVREGPFPSTLSAWWEYLNSTNLRTCQMFHGSTDHNLEAWSGKTVPTFDQLVELEKNACRSEPPSSAGYVSPRIQALRKTVRDAGCLLQLCECGVVIVALVYT